MRNEANINVCDVCVKLRRQVVGIERRMKIEGISW